MLLAAADLGGLGMKQTLWNLGQNFGRFMVAALVYTALAQGANATDLSALQVGEMKKIVIHPTPIDLPNVSLVDLGDAPQDLTQFRGRWALVNFWATWCAPCRAEMPSIGRLAQELPDLQVVLIATGRNPVPQITRFIDEVGVSDLPQLRDPKMALSSQIGILGLPVTIILNPQGQEVARMIGDAEWDAPEALALIDAMMPAD